MSIPGAVVELNREIERLTKIRDSLLLDSSGASQRAQSQLESPQKRKYVRSSEVSSMASKSATRQNVRKKAGRTKKAAPGTKKVVSEATRKKMSDSAKARAASRVEAAK